MKNVLPLLLVTLLVVACKKQTSNTNAVVDKSTTAKASFVTLNKAELSISGMTCEVGCAGTIQKNLVKVEGVQSAEVDFDKQLAMVTFNPSKITLKDLENTVHDTGDIYKVIYSKKVDSYTKEDVEKEHHKCSEECKKECCKDKSAEQASNNDKCKKNCDKSSCTAKA